MKVLVLLCLVAVALSAPQQIQELEQKSDPVPYDFQLEVSDDETTNYQSRSESQDVNGVVQGHYSWIGPDGIRYTTTYTADADNGFQAETVKEDTGIQIIIPVHKPREEQPYQ